jgi:hypothetical protein
MVEKYPGLENQLEQSGKKMGEYHDWKQKPASQYSIDDLVILDGQNIHTKRQCCKFDLKLYGPFQI